MGGPRLRAFISSMWASLGPGADASKRLQGWADALGVDLSKHDEEQWAQASRDAIGRRRMLLVVDDAWDLDTARKLRCDGPNCAVILTTRDKQVAVAFAEAENARNVPVLSEEDAYVLIEHLAPAACRADPEAARAVTSSVGGLPLAVELLGGYLGGARSSQFDLFADISQDALSEMADPAQRLRLTKERLGSLDGELTLEATIALSLEQLPDDQVAAFHALGAFAPKPETFSREAAERVAAASGRTLNVLATRNLLGVDAMRLVMHQTIADVARKRTDPEAVARHRDFYLGMLDQDPDAWERILPDYGQIEWAWNRSTDQETVIELARAVQPFQERRGLWSHELRWSGRALPLAEAAGREDDVVVLLNGVGLAYAGLNKPRDALNALQRSLQLTRHTGDRTEVANALNNLGTVHDDLGAYAAALGCFEEALELHEKEGNRLDSAITLSNIGTA